ncbi:MAG: Hpt domain-containing protein [Actinomycetota bacterium]|nr:Hpt domain-containing protein [Actinomycetota bacterium]
MADKELLEMLAAETDRRAPLMIQGIEWLSSADAPDSDRVEAVRVEAHGLKGAAMVVGESRLALLGERLEIALVQRNAPGTIDAGLGATLAAGVRALQEGARAAAAGQPEPASVDEALAALSDH